MAAHMTAHQIGNWSRHKDLNTLVKSFGTDHVELWTHEYHHEAKEYPDGEYDHFSLLILINITVSCTVIPSS